MRWYITAIKHYFKFGGRARRKEYWMFTLFVYIFSVVAGVLDSIIGINIPVPGAEAIGILSAAYGLFVLIPSFSVLFRRLHDVNKSAWWLLLLMVPLIGWVWIFVLTVLEGTQGKNRFGENSKLIPII